MMDELQVQILARERELDSREGAITTWEDGLAASQRTHGRPCMECNDEHAQAKVVWQNSLIRMHAFTFNSKHSINFNRMLEESQIFLSPHKIDLEL
jgi:hypothetical protein